ncbi:MAG: hypothetical protein DCC67_04580 [Planctomycetota bacterium]|nr:MAG: hypothetical protein DCC67_04580 [Planctomycetota bacterium]
MVAAAIVVGFTQNALAAFPDGWAGYVTHSVTTEPANPVTDFTLLVSLDQLPSEFWTSVQFDGDDIRASKDAAGTQQLPVDVIEFDDDGSTGSGLIAVRWTGVKSASANEPLYIWAGNPAASRPSDADLYGRENAYAAHLRAFWPHGGGEDRTRNGNDLAMNGGPPVVAGPINGSKATDYNGSTQWGAATASVPTSAPLVMIHHGQADNATAPMRSMAVAAAAADDNNFLDLEWRGDVPSDKIQAHAGSANAAASATGFSAGVWHQAVGLFSSHSSRYAGIDGVIGGVDGTPFTPSLNSISVGALKQATARNPFDGRLSMMFLHTDAASVNSTWVAYAKEMLDDADQSDFYGTWTWKTPTSPVNALALGFKPNDPAAAAANAALLAEACKSRRLIVWPAGDFYFGKINTADINSFRQIAWKGAASEYAWQHQEEGTQGDKQLTRFVITGMNTSDVWLDMSAHAATRIGPWRIEDITFQIPSGQKGSLFRIGNPASTSGPGTSIRGLYVRGCYFTFFDHLAGAYLINPSDSPDSGWYLNKPHGRNFAWQVTHGYDTSFEDCSFRGWYVGGEFRQADRFLARNWRGGANGRVIDVYGVPGASAPVPASIFGLWSEGHWVVGANLESCEVHGLNAESGYKASYAPIIGDKDFNNDNPALGGSDSDPFDDDPRRLLESIAWSIPQGASTVSFNNLPSPRVLSDYFDVRTAVRFQPTQADEPPRYLYIESIDDGARTLTFKNSNTTSYIHRAGGLSGNGEGVTRFLGTGVNLVGDKTAVFGHNVHTNLILGDLNHTDPETAEGLGDFPQGFVVPGATPTIVTGGVEGLTKNTADTSTHWAVVADDYGIQHRLCGGVRWIGVEAPDHPLVLKNGNPHLEFNQNIRSMEITRIVVAGDADGDGVVEPSEYRTKIRHRAFPGRGVTAAWDSSRSLRFRSREGVPVHWLRDGPEPLIPPGTGTPQRTWMIPGLRRPGKPVDYVIRIFTRSAIQNENDFVVWAGEPLSVLTFENLAPLQWHVLRGRLEENEVDDDSGEIWLAGGNIEVAWAEFLQDEED